MPRRRPAAGVPALLGILIALSAAAYAGPAWPQTPSVGLPLMPGGRVVSRVVLDAGRLGAKLAELPLLSKGRAVVVTYYPPARTELDEVLRFYDQRLSSGRAGAARLLRRESPDGSGLLAYRLAPTNALAIVRTAPEGSRRRVELFRITGPAAAVILPPREGPSPRAPEPLLERRIPARSLRSLEVSAEGVRLFLTAAPSRATVARIAAFGPAKGAAGPRVVVRRGTARVTWPRPAKPEAERRLEIALPATVSLAATVKGGGVSVKGYLPHTRISTSLAPISVEQASGNLTLTAAMSPVRVREFGGRLRITTSGGGISVSEADLRGTTNWLRATNGTIDAALRTLVAESLDIQAGNASAEVRLPPQPSVTLDVQALGGRIVSPLPLEPVPGGDRFQATLGAGRTRVTLRVTHGNLTLR